MSDETRQQIAGVTIGSVLLLLIVGAWGYIYRLDTAQQTEIESLRREMRAETLRQDSSGEIDGQQLRKEFYEQLSTLRSEMLRLDQRDDEQMGQVLSKIDSINEQLGTLRGDLKVLFSEKTRK